MTKRLRLWKVLFWWEMNVLTTKLWNFFCPVDEASYWLDWLPVFPYRCYHQSLRSYVKRYNENIYGQGI